jgi:hypothetical protein
MSVDDLEDIFAEKDPELDSSVDGGVSSDERDIFSHLEEEADDALVSSENGVIQIGKTKYAINLDWKDAVDAVNAVKEAKVAAQSGINDAQFICIPSSGEAQYALGYKDRGHRLSLPSLAASLQEVLGDNWAASFQYNNSYYIAVVRDGLIHSDYDKLYHSEDEAQTVFKGLLSENWSSIISPKDWHIEGSEEKNIDDLNIDPKLHKLRSANVGKKIIKIGVFVFLFAGFAAGGKFALDYFNTKDAILLAEIREAQRNNTTLNTIVKTIENTVEPVLGIDIPDEAVVEVPPRPPWMGSRMGIGEIIVCTEDIMETTVAVPGWITEFISCGNGTISVSLTNQGGTIGWAEEYLKNNGYPNIDLSESVGSSSIYAPKASSFVTKYAPSLETQDLSKVKNYILRNFEELRQPILWDMRKVNQQNIVDRYYQIADFSIETEMVPTDFISVFRKINPLVVSNISYDVFAKKWKIQGSVFHKRLTPLPRPKID